MKFCRSCNVYLNNENKQCPLCGKESVDKAKVSNVQAYDNFNKKNILDLKEKITSFLCLFLMLCLIVLNVILYDKVQNLFCIYSSILLLVLRSVTKYNKKNLSTNLLRIHLSLFCVMYLLDLFIFKNNIVLTYILPATTIAMLLTMFFITRKKELYQDYFGNIIIHIIVAFVPIILFLTNIVNNVIPSTICLVIGVVSLFICIFKKDTKIELKKRLHI